MQSLSLFLIALVLVASSAFAASRPPAEPKEETFTVTKNAKPVVVSEIPGARVISNWRAPDNHTLIIETYGRGTYRATFAAPCHGIRFAESIAFSTLGPFELDRSTKVILPDGQRCYFKELVEVEEVQLKQ